MEQSLSPLSPSSANPVQLQEVASPPPQIEEQVPSLPSFFPLFNEADQRLKTFYEAGIIDHRGNPLPPFDNIFSILLSSNQQRFRPLFKKIKTILQEPARFNSKKFKEQKDDKNEERYLEIKITLLKYFKFLLHKSLEPIPVLQDDLSAAFLPVSPISDILFIGSILIGELITADILKKISRDIFGGKIPPETITNWFLAEDLQQKFSRQAKDIDFRILTEAGINHQIRYNELTIDFFTNAVDKTSFDPHQAFFKEKLQENFPEQPPCMSRSELLRESVLAFGGLNKYNKIDHHGNAYVITGVDRDNCLPIDLTFVGQDNDGSLTLKNPHLSTTNCWALSFHDLLAQLFFSQTTNASPHYLRFHAGLFSLTKALVDLLTDRSTVYDPNVDAWLRFLQYAELLTNSLHPGIDTEELMVKDALNHRSTFIASDPLLSSLPPLSQASYFFHLFEKHLVKNHLLPCEASSSTVISFLFRACESLHRYSALSDAEIAELWQLADQAGWLTCSDSTVPSFIKEALLKDQMPFSTVSAWLSLLTWCLMPTSLTCQGESPLFRFKHPFPCSLAVKPLEQIQRLLSHLADKQETPSSFRHLFLAFLKERDPSLDTPLMNEWPFLHIDHALLLQAIERCLDHPAPLLKWMGSYLYLSVWGENFSLSLIFPLLPKILKIASESKAETGFLEALLLKASQEEEPPLRSMIEATAVSSYDFEWMHLLASSWIPSNFLLAYELWQKQPSETICAHPETTTKLIHQLMHHSPHPALSLLNTLHTHDPNGSFFKNQCALLIQLGESYRTQFSKEWLRDFPAFVALLRSLLEGPPSLSIDQKTKAALPSLFSLIFETLEKQVEPKEIDRLLTAISRRKWLQPSLQTTQWLSRLEKWVEKTSLLFEKKSFSEAHSNALYASTLFQMIRQEQFLSLTSEQEGKLQLLKIKLGKIFSELREQGEEWLMLEQLLDKPTEYVAMRPFYDWIYPLFKNEIQYQPIEQWHLALLEALIVVTPVDKRFDMQQCMRQFFRAAFNHLSHYQPLDAKDQFLFLYLEKLLTDKESQIFIKQEPIAWKKLMLDFLDLSLKKSTKLSIIDYWTIFEKTCSFFDQTKDSTGLLDLVKLFSQFLHLSSKPLSPFLKSWLEKRHAAMLKNLYDQGCAIEIFYLLQALKHYEIPTKSSAKIAWWLCREHFKMPFPSIFMTALLGLESFEKLKQEIKASDAPLLSHIVSLLLDNHSPLAAWNWLKLCLEQEEKALFIDACFDCADQLSLQKHHFEVVNLLEHLPSLSDEQLKRGQTIWKQLALQPQKVVSETFIRALFLSPSLARFRPIPFPSEEFSEAIKQAIRALLNSPHCSPEAKMTIKELLTTYSIQDTATWKALWLALDPAKEAFLISSLWETFALQQKHLKGDSLAITHCLIEALKQLLAIHHPAIASYAEKPETLLDFYQVPPDAPHLMQLYQALYRIALAHLRSPSVHKNFFSIINQKRDFFLSHFESQEKIASDAILIEQLAFSGSIKGLTIACQLLQSHVPCGSLAPSHDINLFEEILQASQLLFSSHEPSKENAQKELKCLILSLADTFQERATLSLLALLIDPLFSVPFSKIFKWMEILANKEKLTEKEQKQLTSLYLNHFSRALQETNNSLPLIEKFLNFSFNSLHFQLSLENKSLLSHLFLQAAFKAKLPDCTTLYLQWAPHAFAHPNELRKITHLFVKRGFASGASSEGISTTLTYSELAEKALQMKYQVFHLHLPLYQNCVQNYDHWLFSSLQASKIDQPTIIKLFEAHIESVFEQTKKKELPIEEALHILQFFIYFFPPERTLWNQKVEDGTLKLRKDETPLQYSQRMAKEKVEEGKIFENDLWKQYELELWLDLPTLELENPTKKIKIHFELIKRCLEASHHQEAFIYKAIVFLNNLYYHKFCSLKETVEFYEPLFDKMSSLSPQIQRELFEQLSSTIPSVNDLSEEHYLACKKICSLAFKTCLSFLTKLSDVQGDVFSHRHYYVEEAYTLLKQLSLLNEYKDYKQLFDDFNEIQSHLLSLILSHELPDLSLMQEWGLLGFITPLLVSRSGRKPTQLAVEQKKSLWQWLETLQKSLSSPKSVSNTYIVDIILYTVSRLLNSTLEGKNPSYFNCGQPNAQKFLSSLEELSFLTPVQRLEINLLNLYFYRPLLQKNPTFYSGIMKKCFDALLELTLTDVPRFTNVCTYFLNILMYSLENEKGSSPSLQPTDDLVTFFDHLRSIFTRHVAPPLPPDSFLSKFVEETCIRTKKQFNKISPGDEIQLKQVMHQLISFLA